MTWLKDLIYERLPRKIAEFESYINDNEIVIARTQGVSVLTSEEAIGLSCAGPLLRASGVQYDVRRAQPYSYYEELDFDVAVRYGGDLLARYFVRVDEMWQSLRILRQILPHLEATKGAPIQEGKPAYNHRVRGGGDVYGRVENPKGELGYYMIAKRAASNPYRYHIRAPSFINLTGLEKMSIGNKVADLVVILGSIDIVLGEVDR